MIDRSLAPVHATRVALAQALVALAARLDPAATVVRLPRPNPA